MSSEVESTPEWLMLEHGVPEDQAWALHLVHDYPEVVQENPLALLHVLQSLVYGWTDFDSLPMPDGLTIDRGLGLLPDLDYSDSAKEALAYLLNEDGVVAPMGNFKFLPKELFPDEVDLEVLENQKKFYNLPKRQKDMLWKPS